MVFTFALGIKPRELALRDSYSSGYFLGLDDCIMDPEKLKISQLRRNKKIKIGFFFCSKTLFKRHLFECSRNKD